MGTPEAGRGQNAPFPTVHRGSREISPITTGIDMNRTFARSQVTNQDRLLEVADQEAIRFFGGPVDRTITYKSDTIEVEWSARLQTKLEADTALMKLDRIVAETKSGNRMGKLHEVAQRIAKTRQTLSDEADKLASKLDGLDRKAPGSFARAHQVIEQHSADIDAMDGELRQLSNLPLDGSQG